MTFETKRCRKCALDKPINAFSHDKSRADGRQNTCRDCQSIIAKHAYQRRKAAMTNEVPENFVCYVDHARQFRVICNSQQWLLQKFTSTRKWRTLSYVGSNGATLIRVFAMNGAIPTDEVRDMVMSWGRFLDWVETRAAEDDHRSLLDAA